MNKARKRQGFTLTEILVVLTILAVLASILFAVIGRAKEHGRSAVCQSNLKQIALAVQQYVQDNNWQYPGFTGYFSLAPYISLPATEKEQVFKCPSQYDRSPGDYHYVYNLAVTETIENMHFKGKHEAALLNTATIWLNTDGRDRLNPESHTVTVTPARGHGCTFTTWHRSGANYSFLDGHVKWLNPVAACTIDNADLIGSSSN